MFFYIGARFTFHFFDYSALLALNCISILNEFLQSIEVNVTITKVIGK
jgi:hypothetical protein